MVKSAEIVTCFRFGVSDREETPLSINHLLTREPITTVSRHGRISACLNNAATIRRRRLLSSGAVSFFGTDSNGAIQADEPHLSYCR